MVLAFERWGCADIAAPGCAGILGDFRWSPRDLLEEKTGGAKGFLDFVFHLVSLPYSLQMSIHSIHSIHSISEKRENHEKPKTES